MSPARAKLTAWWWMPRLIAWSGRLERGHRIGWTWNRFPYGYSVRRV